MRGTDFHYGVRLYLGVSKFPFKNVFAMFKSKMATAIQVYVNHLSFGRSLARHCTWWCIRFPGQLGRIHHSVLPQTSKKNLCSYRNLLHMNIFHQNIKVYLRCQLNSSPEKLYSQNLQTFTIQTLRMCGTLVYCLFIH